MLQVNHWPYRIGLGALLAVAAVLSSPSGNIAADERTAQQTTPSGTPSQTVPQAQQDQDSGRSLSGQLDQTNGVIRPPSGVDPGAVQPTPKVGPQSTPVIPPPGTSGGDQEVKPK